MCWCMWYSFILGWELNKENKVDYRFCAYASFQQIYYFDGVSFTSVLIIREKIDTTSI